MECPLLLCLSAGILIILVLGLCCCLLFVCFIWKTSSSPSRQDNLDSFSPTIQSSESSHPTSFSPPPPYSPSALEEGNPPRNPSREIQGEEGEWRGEQEEQEEEQEEQGARRPLLRSDSSRSNQRKCLQTILVRTDAAGKFPFAWELAQRGEQPVVTKVWRAETSQGGEPGSREGSASPGGWGSLAGTSWSSSHSFQSSLVANFPLPRIGERIVMIDGEPTMGKSGDEVREVLHRASLKGYATLLLG